MSPMTAESLRASQQLSVWLDALDWVLAVKDLQEIRVRRDRIHRELVEALRPPLPNEREQ